MSIGARHRISRTGARASKEAKRSIRGGKAREGRGETNASALSCAHTRASDGTAAAAARCHAPSAVRFSSDTILQVRSATLHLFPPLLFTSPGAPFLPLLLSTLLSSSSSEVPPKSRAVLVVGTPATHTRTTTTAGSCVREDHRTRHLHLASLPTVLRPPSTPCLTSSGHGVGGDGVKTGD